MSATSNQRSDSEQNLESFAVPKRAKTFTTPGMPHTGSVSKALLFATLGWLAGCVRQGSPERPNEGRADGTVDTSQLGDAPAPTRDSAEDGEHVDRSDRDVPNMSADAPSTVGHVLFLHVDGGLYGNRLFEARVFELPGRVEMAMRRVEKFPRDGNSTVEIGRVLRTGHDYEVDYFFDLDDSGACNSSDQVIRQRTSGVGRDVTLQHPPVGDWKAITCP